MTLFVATHFQLCGWLLLIIAVGFWGGIWYLCVVAAPRTKLQRENGFDAKFRRVRR